VTQIPTGKAKKRSEAEKSKKRWGDHAASVHKYERSGLTPVRASENTTSRE